MKRLFILSLLTMVISAFFADAQIVTTEPAPLQEDSENAVIYYHADQGNKGLMGLAPSAEVYAHTGVCVTDASGKTENWKYAPDWNTNLPKYRMEYAGTNLWKLTLGNIRTFYGVSAEETVTKLAFVFRTGDRKKEGKTESGGDIFVNVMDGGFQLALTSTLDAGIVTGTTGEVTFTAASTRKAEMTLYCNNEIIAQASGATSLEGRKTFAAAGDYVIKAVATADGVTVEKSIDVCYASPARPSGLASAPAMGATRNADGSVTFCLAAPGIENVILVGSWNDYRITDSQSMQYVDETIDGGTFRFYTITLPNLPKDTPLMYYYITNSTTSVGDPYARLVLAPEEDKYIPASVYPGLPQYPYDKLENVPLAVFDDNFGAYIWKCNDFKGVSPDNLIIYEMLVRDFTGTEGKALGDGTIRGAIGKIGYLKQLGINAVELLPINEFNGNISWGYNPNFYFAVDKAYGTPQDYKEFIDECHRNGIAVILDMVFNQSDWMHPWYRMYPVGSNPFYNATAPHSYSVLNDWNQGYPLVGRQWEDCLKYWLAEYHVDGFRFDLVKGLGDNDSYANPGEAATNAYNESRVKRMKRLHDAMRTVNPNAYFINENLAGEQEENEMAADGELNWENYNEQGCQYAMGYDSKSDLNGMLAAKMGRTPGSTVSYLESHDEQRLAYKQQQWGDGVVKTDANVAMRRLASAAAQMLLVPGAHMIWQFSEMGNAQNTKNPDGSNNVDPKIVDWGLLDNAANRGLYDCYRQLVGLRLQNEDLFGSDAEYNNNCAYWKVRTITSAIADKELLAVINPSVTEAVTVNMPFRSSDDNAYHIVSKAFDTEPTFNASTKMVTVPANSYVVVASRNVTGIDEIVAPESESRIRVEGGKGVLNIVGATNQVTVCDVHGMIVAREEGRDDIRISLDAGIYVVRMGAETRKVLVK